MKAEDFNLVVKGQQLSRREALLENIPVEVDLKKS